MSVSQVFELDCDNNYYNSNAEQSTQVYQDADIKRRRYEEAMQFFTQYYQNIYGYNQSEENEIKCQLAIRDALLRYKNL